MLMTLWYYPQRQRGMEVSPGDGERTFRARRTEPRKQAVKGDNEDVPFHVRSWLFVSCG